MISQNVKYAVETTIMNIIEDVSLGFPGAIGSVDCIHVKWLMCSKDDRWHASGKEGCPLRQFPFEC